MRKTRFDQYAPLTGIVFVVLYVVGRILVSSPGYLPEEDDVVVTYFSDDELFVGAALGVLGVFFLLWFAGSVRSALREFEGADGWLSAVSFGGGVAAATAGALGFGVLLIGNGRAGTDSGISAAEAIILYDLWGSFETVVTITLAAFVGAAAIVALRTKMFPTWFGWAGVVAALACLSPVGYILVFLALVWLAVMSIRLTMRGVSPQSSSVESSGSADE